MIWSTRIAVLRQLKITAVSWVLSKLKGPSLFSGESWGRNNPHTVGAQGKLGRCFSSPCVDAEGEHHRRWPLYAMPLFLSRTDLSYFCYCLSDSEWTNIGVPIHPLPVWCFLPTGTLSKAMLLAEEMYWEAQVGDRIRKGDGCLFPYVQSREDQVSTDCDVQSWGWSCHRKTFKV